MAEARCPASCGELIQGWLSGSEKLISCPVDWFSTVSVSEDSPNPASERPMMRRALRLALQTAGLPVTLENQLRIDYESTIPVAKGMASSTADIAATATATLRHFGQDISEHELLRLCVSLEPTDSTVCSHLALLDHRSGTIAARFPAVTQLDILILESHQRLETAAYHRLSRQEALLQSAPVLEKALHTLDAGIRQGMAKRIGEAVTLSALESQRILKKPGLSALLDLVEQHGLHGLNVAHSGSVVGLFFDHSRHDIEKTMAAIRQGPLHHDYPTLHLTRMIGGGII